MSLNSVKTYIATQGATVSLTSLIWKNAVVAAQRPKRGKAGFNVFVIVGRVRRREQRATMPRGPAEKESVYDVDVMFYAEHTDAKSGGDHFDALIENACQVYRTTTGNPTLTDSFGAASSYLTDVGETMDVEILPPFFTDDSESRTAFQGILTFNLREILTA